MLLISSIIIPLHSPPTILLQWNKVFPNSTNPVIAPWRSGRKPTSTLQNLIKVSCSENDRKVDVPSTSQSQDVGEVIKSFYAGINTHDLASLELLVAENCVYEDLIMFSRPIVGRKALLEGYKSFIDAMSMDLQHVIDDMTSSTNLDSSTVGVAWHFEWKGKALPYSKGCSFYQLEIVDGKRQIVYGRDAAESLIKLGKAGLVVIKSTTWLLQQFPQLEDQL
ncbi:uncharacterized protein LOC111276357 [Durio zibethinus]|uniref:Uncharacterized protein LOC111276357 n=1 Tax=Durio zibethinus TaxID=66656 RepID=A0A6P5WP96_DURZI|nr:uncharacterized protein LOC111276357 [Durio zibethinus]